MTPNDNPAKDDDDVKIVKPGAKPPVNGQAPAKPKGNAVLAAIENLEEAIEEQGEQHTVWAQILKSLSFGKARLEEKAGAAKRK